MSGERLARSRSAANPPFDHIGFNAGQSKNGQSPAEKPTDAFLKAIEMADITVRGWEIPAHKFRARKTSRNTLKVEGRGWIDPNDKTGNLKLSVNGNREGVYATEQDPQVMAFKSVLALAGIHGVYTANGGMQTDA
jgi:hypothetical protein